MITRRGRKGRRLTLIGTAGLALGAAAALMFYALGDRITYAATPTDLLAGVHAPGMRVRLGGLVETGSVQRGADGRVAFAVTDTANRVPVSYTGLLPDLFREGQGVVTEGVIDPSGALIADTVLARHDERYMPKEVVDALKAQGRWQEGAMTGMEDAATRAVGPQSSLGGIPPDAAIARAPDATTPAGLTPAGLTPARATHADSTSVVAASIGASPVATPAGTTPAGTTTERANAN